MSRKVWKTISLALGLLFLLGAFWAIRQADSIHREENQKPIYLSRPDRNRHAESRLYVRTGMCMGFLGVVLCSAACIPDSTMHSLLGRLGFGQQHDPFA